MELYYRNTGTQTSTPGLSLVHKLMYEHIYLTSFPKCEWIWQYRFAVYILRTYYIFVYFQVLSNSVSKAIELQGGPNSFETAYFIQKMNYFLDCLNVSSYSAGKRNRNVFQQPYLSPTDFRLKVSLCTTLSFFNDSFDLQFLKELISYLDHWKYTVVKRDGCDDKEKMQMVLSNITDQGIRITGTYPAVIVCLFTINFVFSFFISGTDSIFIQN